MLKFQIVEFNDSTDNSKVFSVLLGTVVTKHWFLCFNKREIVWEWLKEENAAKDAAATKYDTFGEAKRAIDDVKKQLPIYYNVE